MITAPADFIAAEKLSSRQSGIEIFFSLVAFATGLAADSGVFVNCAFVSPDRIEVTYGATGASWTGPLITNVADVLPLAIVVSWRLNYPGYDFVAEYRTADNETQAGSMAWTAMASGDTLSLNRYYQVRFTWTAIRSWFVDTALEAAADPYAFHFCDTDADDYVSYFCDGVGVISYLETLQLLGEYQLNPHDLADPGEINEPAVENFGEVAVATASFVLKQFDRYTPGHPDFVLGANWYRRNLRIAQWRIGAAGNKTASIDIFKGVITRWQRQDGVDPDGKKWDPGIEVEAENKIGQILESRLGVPDNDGTPRPFCAGQFLKELQQLEDECLRPPDKVVSGDDTDDFSTLEISGAGSTLTTVTDALVGPVFQAHVAVAGGYAKGLSYLVFPNHNPLFSVQVMFPELKPVSPGQWVAFMGLVDASGKTWNLKFSYDYRVWIHQADADFWRETDWYVNEDVGVYKKVSIAMSGIADGVLRLWLDSSELFSERADWSDINAMKGGWVGLALDHAESWDIYFYQVEVSKNWEEWAYRLYGAPFLDFVTVYENGTIIQEKPGIRQYIGGRSVAGDVLIKYPSLGVIIFNDPANPPKGTIYALVKKDNLTHPADVLPAAFAAAGFPDVFTAASLTACKAATPEQAIGCFFEDTDLGAVVRAIAEPCLIDILPGVDDLKLQAYLGTAAQAQPVKVIDDWTGYEQELAHDRRAIYSRARYKLGNWDRNRRLECKAVDTEALRLLTWPQSDDPTLSLADLEPLGRDLEMDLSYGNDVSAASRAMVQNLADRLLNRVKAGQESLDSVLFHSGHSRLQPGDFIQIICPQLLDSCYRITGKRHRLGPDFEVECSLVKYLGEAQPQTTGFIIPCGWAVSGSGDTCGMPITWQVYLARAA